MLPFKGNSPLPKGSGLLSYLGDSPVSIADFHKSPRSGSPSIKEYAYERINRPYLAA
ncbi:hypothetical protein JCM17207_22380 [Faecalibacterium gallinarum]|uniref:Uncharacterized protein n=1 Tax=Faecalibacterium gallinarum TaxID=2903556 RepID=A0AA37J0G6_9FIRM|nr:hypothetical protein JCM17207_22380 [Faecalibacterium gallinarum]